MRGDDGDVHGPGGDVDKEQDVMRDQTPDRAHFDTQKVRRCQTFPVSLKKRRPSGVSVSLGSWFDSVLFKDIADGGASTLLPRLGHCASNSRISPRWIFKRHPRHKINH